MRCVRCRLFSIIFIFYTNALCFGQANLISNPGFEDFSICPNDISQLERSSGWFTPTPGTSDYFNGCSGPGLQVSIGQNGFGYQLPFEGEGMAGFWADYLNFSDSINVVQYREYLSYELTNALKKDIKYELRFYVCLSEISEYAVSKIGASFSIDRPSSDTSLNLFMQPQVINDSGFIQDTLNWQLIEGDFIAAGGEKFITIGLFTTELDTLMLVNSSSIGMADAYYFVDGISLKREYKNPKLVFSPNDDNINDVIDFNDVFADDLISVKVFSRWGRLVFDCINSSCVWNGYFNGSLLPQGTYYYVVSNTLTNFDSKGIIVLY
jgi:gliding motility-associated-like protein